MEIIKEKMALVNFRAMFYLVTPNETSFEKTEDVPNYVDGAVPYFAVLIFVEMILLKLQGRDLPPFQDSVNSVSHGIMSLLSSLLFRSLELVIYVNLYDRFCLIKLPWNSPWVWFATFILIDFVYYWFHRFGHEINFIWASHQVHHSSQEYNLSTALRQSIVQKYFNMFLNFPLALFIPPSIFYIHIQFNLLYQFWIHTEVVSNIGPLEYILNTPSHHRVHHGRNPYCIDKNYAGTLIIWDRIFKTFAPEGEKVAYGLVHPNDFWDPLKGQVFHFLYILGLVKSHDGIGNKVSAIVKGPGWIPGSPWLGYSEDLPEVEQPEQKYHIPASFGLNFYVGLHFFLVLFAYSTLASLKQDLPQGMGITSVAFIMLSLYSFGALYDQRSFAKSLECIRCFLFMGMATYFGGPTLHENPIGVGLYLLFALSALLWGIIIPLFEGDRDSDLKDEVKKTE